MTPIYENNGGVVRSRLTVGALREALAGREDDELVAPVRDFNAAGEDMEDEAPLVGLLGVTILQGGRVGIVVELSYFEDDEDWREDDEDEDEDEFEED